MVGSAYAYDFNQALSVTGDPGFTGYGLKWSVASGALPAGLTLNTSTGVISGTPATDGTYAFTLNASYKTKTGTNNYQVVVANMTVTLGAATLSAGAVGVPFSYDFKPLLTVTGDASYTASAVTWSATSVPAGLTLNSSGVLSGTPTTAGTSTLNVTAAYKSKSAQTGYSLAIYNSIVNQGLYRTWSDGTVAASCKDYKNGAGTYAYRGATGDGVYRVKPTGAASAVDVYCDMTTDGGGWMMAYKHPKGLTSQPYAIWNGTTAYAGTTPNKTTAEVVFVPTLTTTAWASLTEARVEVIKNGTAQQYIKFNTSGKDKLSWFAKANITASSWTDLTSSTFNYFSILGDSANSRGWFVNNLYNNCPGDIGWLGITYNPSKDTCSQQGSWQSIPVGTIFYSTLTTKGAEANTAQFSQADALVVLVR